MSSLWLLAAVCGLLLDRMLGEPKVAHPLVGFGNFASKTEKRLNRKRNFKKPALIKMIGVLAWLIVVVPFVLLGVLLQRFMLENAPNLLTLLVASVFLYLAVGWRSLLEHAKAVYEPLEGLHYAKNSSNEEAVKIQYLERARLAVSYIVSRDTKTANEDQLATAATESVLENGADAIFCAIFWFVLFGIPGVILYRLSNTLDAMWGYKNDRFLYFGWFAARVDDLLNFIPARLTALTYVLNGNVASALKCWRLQAPTWKSPNAGPVMAAGAGAIEAPLGGAAVYGGAVHDRPTLGVNKAKYEISYTHIKAACRLVNRGVFLWAALMIFLWLI